MTREEWSKKFLEGIDAPVTRRNMLVLISWIQSEGNGGSYNPLNSTHTAAGATTFNSAGVKNYPDAATGLEANIETLNYGADRNTNGYRLIRHRLRANAGALGTMRAIKRSDWGTGKLGVTVVRWLKTSLQWDYLKSLEIHHH